MKLHQNFGKRILAVLLTLAMVLSYLPAVAQTVSAATVDSRVADPHTLDQWKNYFGVLTDNPNNVKLTTEYAGGVWTDKSVFTPNNLPEQLTGATYNGNGISVTDRGDNFYVSLSAIASNKQITGYSTVPTDTVLVLDLSSSMRYTDDDGRSAVDELVEATNKAMTQLLELNKNNRIAVVVYAGNQNESFSVAEGNVSVVLPLDSYTTDREGVYLQNDPINSNNPYALAVYDGVSSASGNANSFRNNGFEVATGTFLQGGIYEAMKILLDTDPVVQEGVQKGTSRMPIMIWMTDGESTMGNPDYNGNDTRTSIGTTTMHDFEGNTGSANGSYGHRDTISFVTSLTAAFANKAVAEHYGQDPLVYTLPYGETVMNRSEALSVLNPAAASTTQNNLWNAFLNGEEVTVYRYRQNNRYTYLTTQNSNVASERLEAADRLYVDRYFPANNDEEMLQAFQDIVNEIILQSKYYPTYVQKDVDHDGYLTFVDKIGEYMEVTEVDGIIIGDHLFSGAVLASKFNAGDLGTAEDPTTLGDNFVWSVQERLGITDASVARALLNHAYLHGQIAYTNDTNFSHYIGWYSDAQGNYVDAWHDGMTAEQVPANATHIIKSYGFMGDTTVVPGVANTDMMYMSVRVAQEIATGETIVTWQVPASLIPTLSYNVEVEVDSDGNITELRGLTLESETAESPIRLVYEVAVRSDIQDWNLTEKVDPNYTAEKDAGYVLYTNKWTQNPDDTTRNTYSHFEPSVENERYYFTQDTVVLVPSGDTYVPYTGGNRPDGTGYYYAYQVYEQLNDGSLRTHIHYEPITDTVLDNTSAVVQDNGQWVVKKGTVHRYYDYEISGKAADNTNTMDYSDHPFVIKQNEHYYTYSTQGNNGKLVLTPATGLKLTKSLTEGFTTEEQFTFVISGDISGAQVVRLTADGKEASRTALAADGQVTLKAGETVYIVGLSASAYTVSEIVPANADYSVASVLVDQTAVAGTQANVSLTAQDITAVEFVNGPMGYGNLIISKDVSHPFNTVPDAITNKVFNIQVQLIGEDVANASFGVTGIAGVTEITTDADGIFHVELHDGESVTVTGLPENTAYIVTENLTSADVGYSLDTANSKLSGSITKNESAMAQVVNIYAPAPAQTTVAVTGTKTVNSQSVPYDWTDKSFQFRLESYDPNTQTYTLIEEANVTTNGGSYTFSGLTFDTIGTYYYKVSEVIPAEREPHMSYDASTGRFLVHVTDNDVDGVLEIEVVDYVTNMPIAASDNVVTFTKDFVNTYTEQYDPTAVEFTVNKDIEDSHQTGVTAAGFLFGLYKEGETQPSYTMRTTGADGKVTFHIPITEPIAGDTYILKEIIPAEVDRVPGMIYDTTEYTVVISATAEGAVLTGKVTINGQEGVEPLFTNKVELTPASAQFEVEKVMQGEFNAEETFTFQLVETDGSFVTAKGNPETIQITNNGSAKFNSISYTSVGTHYYVVKEIAGSRGGMAYDASVYHITVNVTAASASDDLVAQVTIAKQGVGAVEEITFTNTYSVAGSTSAVITAEKVLTGRPLLNGEFKFQLVEVADETGTAKENPLTLTAENGPANGDNQASVVFAPIPYTELGTHYYKISEIPGESNVGLTYDGSAFIVKVVVSDNNQGGLSANWSVVGHDAAVFRNSYKPSGTSTQISSSKDLTGRVLKPGEFFFELYETGADFSIDGLDPKQVVSNNIHGAIHFDTLHFSEECVKHYVIKEQQGTVGGVTYDQSVYHVTINVVDNHQGSLVTFTAISMVDEENNEIPVSSIVFYNEYAPANTEVELTVQKNMEGSDVLSGYTFGLYEDLAAAPIQTVTSDADGIVSFEKLNYSYLNLDPGVYTYYIAEIVPEGAVNGVLNGVTYDDKIYTVVVTLTDDLEGNLVATYTVDGADVDESTYRFQFTNTYQVAPIDYTLRATKIYENQSGEMEEFDFVLEGQDIETQTVQNDSDGNIVFAPITFTKAGQYTVTVREQENILWGLIKWDVNVYTVTITVEEDTSTGTLYIDADKIVVQSDNGREDLVFYNVNHDMITKKEVALVSQPDISIDGEKVLVGDVLTYTITYKNYNTTAQQVQIVDFIPNHTAYVEGSATGTPTFRDDGAIVWDMGQIEPFETVSVKFEVKVVGPGTIENDAQILEGNNTYTTNTVTNTVDDAETELALRGEKNLHFKGLEAGQFTFALYDSEGNELEQTTNLADGSFTFGAIKYTAEDVGKTFTYTIKEIEPDGAVNHALDGITYDQTVYTVSVQVLYNAQSELVTAVAVTGGETGAVEFNNYYNITGEGTVEIVGNKSYIDTNTNAPKDMEAGQFTFRLTGHGQDLTTTNDANGNFKFALSYTAADAGKEYTYTVKEVAGDKDYIGYDSREFRVVVKVEDDGKGGLTITTTMPDGAIALRNDYNTIRDGEIVIDGDKTYTDANTGEEKTLEAGRFTFRLTGHGQELTTTNDANGNFNFRLGYTKADIGKTYTYTVKEVAGDVDYITYDSREFQVVVKVEDDGQGGLTITKTLVNGDISFQNYYNTIGTGSVTVDGTKTYLNKHTQQALTISKGMFSFRISGNGVDETVSCAEGGNFAFSVLTYDRGDVGKTYTYTIEEVAGSASYITYDTTKYILKVSVADDGQGGLTITKELTSNGVAVQDIAFSNVYSASGQIQVPISGTKYYMDGQQSMALTVPADMFRFKITGSDGYRDVTANQAGGSFAFAALTYTAEDVGKSFSYTIEEIAGDAGYVDYDNIKHTLIVTIGDDGQGGMTVKLLLNGQETDTVHVRFTNIYNITGTGNVEIAGNKTYTDANTGAVKGLEAGQFTFRLTGHGLDLTTTNDASGNFGFNIAYTAEDVGQEYIYTVSEVSGDKAYIAYDSALFRVKVKVEDDGQGGLVVTKTLLDGDITFQNRYNTVGTGSITVEGTKSYTDGRTQQAKSIADGQFHFRISGNGIDETVVCDAQGNFHFSALNYTAQDVGKTYTYTVEEVAGDKAYITYDSAKYTLQVTVADDGQGGLTITKQLMNAAGETVENIAFHNVYNVVEGGQVDLSGVKHYTDATTGLAKPMAAGQFSFRISGNGADETVVCDAQGNFHFAPLTYTAADIGKTYTYTVEEVAGELDYITYDSTKYTLEVTVEDNGKGGLTITKRLLNSEGAEIQSLAFHNVYNVTGVGQVNISGVKVYEGRDLVGNDFTFVLSQNDRVVQTAQNNADGSFAFTALEYTAADIGKTYTYTAYELRPADAKLNADGVYQLDGVIYDANVYTIEVSIADNGEGGLAVTKKLNGEAAEQIHVVFDNKYQLSGTAVLELTGIKKLTGRELQEGEFVFALCLDGKPIDTATNEGGKFTLGTIYGVEDLGEYTYTVEEVAGNVSNITYDATVYQVKVKVYDDGKGGIAVAYELVDAEQIVFENVFTPPATPETGDNFQVTLFIGLMVLSTFGIAAIMVCKKRDEQEETAE